MSGAAEVHKQREVNAEELLKEGLEKDQDTPIDQHNLNLPILKFSVRSSYNDDNTICCSADCCSDYHVPYKPSSKQLSLSLNKKFSI